MEDFVYIGTKYKTKKSCLKNLEIGDLLGEGNFGQVYDACDPDCTSVLKVMIIPPEFGNDFKTEVAITQWAGELEIGPKFIDSWTCEAEDDYGVIAIGLILTEKYEMSLERYLKKYKKMESGAALTLMELIKAMHHNGIIHGDLHPRNIVVDTNKKEIKRISIIDYGLAFYKENVPNDIQGRFGHATTSNKLKVKPMSIDDMVRLIEYIDDGLILKLH